MLTVLLMTPAAEAARKHSHRAAGDHSTDDTSIGSGVGGGSNGSFASPSPTTAQQQQLWVFGDSYADTGNLGDLGRELTHAWYDPYGATFPGRPTGRFSDGRVLTDFIGTVRLYVPIHSFPFPSEPDPTACLLQRFSFSSVGNNRSNYICTSWDMGWPAPNAMPH